MLPRSLGWIGWLVAPALSICLLVWGFTHNDVDTKISNALSVIGICATVSVAFAASRIVKALQPFQMLFYRNRLQDLSRALGESLQKENATAEWAMLAARIHGVGEEMLAGCQSQDKAIFQPLVELASKAKRTADPSSYNDLYLELVTVSERTDRIVSNG